MLTDREPTKAYSNINFKIDDLNFENRACFSAIPNEYSDKQLNCYKKLTYIIYNEDLLVDKTTCKKYIQLLKLIFKFKSRSYKDRVEFYFYIKKNTERVELLLPLTALRHLQQYVEAYSNGGIVVETFLKLVEMFPEKNKLHLLTLADNKQVPNNKCDGHSLTYKGFYLANNNAELIYTNDSINSTTSKDKISAKDLKILNSVTYD